MTNAEIIQRDLDWLERVIKVRIEFPKVDIFDPELLMNAVNRSNTLLMHKEEYVLTPPDISNYSSGYANAVKSVNWRERLLLILALSVQIESGFIDRITEKSQYENLIDKMPGFWTNAGIVGRASYGYGPTGRFWLFLLAGYDGEKRIGIINKVLSNKVQFFYTGLIDLTSMEEHEPFLGGVLKINRENLAKLLL